MRRHGLLALVVALAASHAHADEPIPDRWRKTMTNDPATNAFLGKYTTPMPTRIEETGRILVLVRLLGHVCQSATVNERNLSAFLQRSGLRSLAKSDLKQLSDDVGERFDGFDSETAAHLCSGVTYLFGPTGKLGRNFMTAGSGDLTLPYDPANPYLRVPPLVPDDP